MPKSSQPAPSQPPDVNPFPIAGIGVSAGGLEVLEQFLHHVPADSSMAFVIVQHLDPTHKGVMPELLQRCTVLLQTESEFPRSVYSGNPTVGAGN